MRKSDAVRYFGNEYRLAKALNINQSAVSRWTTYVPLIRAIQLERISGGKLRADTASYEKRSA